MSRASQPEYRHDGAERIGVLLVNSGTPDDLSVGAVRRFLGALLADPRVVELPRALWLPLLHGIILRTRPSRSARKYRRIWTPEGSPLLLAAEQLRERLADSLARRTLAPLSVELGMLYSNPSVPVALRRLRDAGAQRIVVMPVFPQYCGATTGPVFDQVAAELTRWRWVPELRFVSDYHDHPGYIDALRTSIASHWALRGRTQHLLISFHGIPERYFTNGDPYYCKCQKTARLLAEELNLREGEWGVSFQSKFGPGHWLKPYTSDVVGELPRRGIDEVTLVCPGFAGDCLETLDEIEIEARRTFIGAGGRRFEYVPALNGHPDHARFLADIVTQNAAGWLPVSLGFLEAAKARRAPAPGE